MSRPLAFWTGAIVAATLLSYGGRWLWVCELLVNFRTHLALLSCLALIVAIVLRRWRIAGAAAIGIALNVWPMYAAFLGTGAPPVADARAVRVAVFNVHFANDDLAGIAAYLESQKADVVVLAELSRENAERLAALMPRLPHRFLAGHEGVWGLAILSRWPLIEPQPVAPRTGRKFAAQADVDLGDRRLRLYGAHLDWPLVPARARTRNEQLQVLGRALVDCPHACVAVGDFNVTPWSSHFRGVLKSPDVYDCAAGRGLLNTWSSSLPAVLRIRIDQCVVAGAAGVTDARVGESVGSDHLSAIYDLSIGLTRER